MPSLFLVSCFELLRHLAAHLRDSRPEVFSEKGALKNFAKFTGGLQLY